MEEVIAHRYTVSKKVCLYLIGLGILGLALGVFIVIAKEANLFSYAADRQWVLIIIYTTEFVAGAFAIIFGTINLIRAKKIQSELIVLNDNHLTFADGSSCDIKEIVNVSYHISKLQNSGIGRLQINLTDRTVKFKQVKNAYQAYKRIVELIEQSREEENNG